MVNSINITQTHDEELNKIIALLETTISLIPESIMQKIQDNDIEEDLYQTIYLSALESKHQGLTYMRNSLDILDTFKDELKKFFKDYNLLS